VWMLPGLLRIIFRRRRPVAFQHDGREDEEGALVLDGEDWGARPSPALR